METTTNRMLVAVDPSSDHGESGLDFARAGGTSHVTVLVSLSGPSAWALEAFAESEEISVAEAAEIYLSQVIDRLHARGVDATGLFVSGLDLAADLAAHAVETGAGIIVMPAGGSILGTDEVDQVARMAGVPVVIVPPHLYAAA